MTEHKRFNFSHVEDFDKHISMSIPNYEGLIDIVKAFFLELMPPMGLCVDVGCSTGSLLNDLSPMTEGEYIGVDELEFKGDKDFVFVESDALEYLRGLKEADVIICLFVLQFLGRKKRGLVLAELERLIKGGAVLILAEKLYMGDALINGVFHRKHMMKKRLSFEDGEILDKDEALFGSMYCESEEAAQSQYMAIGSSTRIWQSYNFAAWIITEPT